MSEVEKVTLQLELEDTLAFGWRTICESLRAVDPEQCMRFLIGVGCLVISVDGQGNPVRVSVKHTNRDGSEQEEDLFTLLGYKRRENL